jgi:hypothetical protein
MKNYIFTACIFFLMAFFLTCFAAANKGAEKCPEHVLPPIKISMPVETKSIVDSSRAVDCLIINSSAQQMSDIKPAKLIADSTVKVANPDKSPSSKHHHIPSATPILP